MKTHIRNFIMIVMLLMASTALHGQNHIKEIAFEMTEQTGGFIASEPGPNRYIIKLPDWYTFDILNLELSAVIAKYPDLKLVEPWKEVENARMISYETETFFYLIAYFPENQYLIVGGDEI